MEWLMLPGHVHPLGYRAEQVSAHGLYAYDMVHVMWSCASCEAVLTDGTAALLATPSYSNLAEARATIASTVSDALAQCAPPTCRCGARARLDHANHHLYHSRLGRDVVLRYAPRSPQQMLSWDGTAGFAPLALTDGEARWVQRDALLRAAGALRDRRHHTAMLEVLLRLNEAFPGDAELARFFPQLMSIGAGESVGALAEHVIAETPQEASGYYWLAQVVLDEIAAGRSSPDIVAEVEPLFQEALARRPDYPDAELGLATVAQVAGDTTLAAERLRDLLTRHPEHAEGSYTLALLLESDQPEEALHLLETAERAVPDREDYPLARARILAALGRQDEAQAAVTRSEELRHREPRAAVTQLPKMQH